MRLDLAHHHLSRRDALKFGAAGAVAAVTASVVNVNLAAAEDHNEKMGKEKEDKPEHKDDCSEFTDEMFDVAAVIAGGFWVSPYGPADGRGTFNEVTAERTAKALSVLKRNRPVNTYQMGEEMFNGFPAFPSDPPRLHDMSLYVFGYVAPPYFVAGGGIQSGTEPFGPNGVVGHEERFAENFTFQIASQIDGLGHVGIATGDDRLGWFYNDNYASDLISPTGLTHLGNETMGPLVTRGVILDILGLKMASDSTDDFFFDSRGNAMLRGNYRITCEDIQNSMHRQRIRKPIGPGDVPIFRTGWTHLAHGDEGDQMAYLAEEPGIYLAEARYLEDKKVALIAADTWGLEVLDPAVTGGNAFPCHQELLGKTGIRIGESFVCEAAVADHVYEGVLVVTPENVPGATCGSSAPAFLGQPGRKPRD